MENKVIIGIDASRSNAKQLTGTEYYSFEIIKEIIKDPRYFFRLYSKSPLQYIKKNKNIENRVMPFPKLWSQVRLSYEIWKKSPDVLFEPSHTIPIYHGRKTVVTLHDVGFRYYPELYTPLERIYHNFCMGFSVKHSSKIIAISQATERDLIKFYMADPKKIYVIYHGYDKSKYHVLKKNEKPPEIVKNNSPYIYFIGRLEAKKNLVNLIKAYEILRRNKNIKHKLVLAGRPGYQYEKIRDEIKRLPKKIKKDIIELGYIPDDKVGPLMRFASILAFPSNFEGFGMPLVEAMASGVPVVASNTTSIPEIVGKAGLLSNPSDFVKLADNLKEVIINRDISSHLVKAGLKRAKRYSWEKAAQETLKVIASTAPVNVIKKKKQIQPELLVG